MLLETRSVHTATSQLLVREAGQGHYCGSVRGAAPHRADVVSLLIMALVEFQ